MLLAKWQGSWTRSPARPNGKKVTFRSSNLQDIQGHSERMSKVKCENLNFHKKSVFSTVFGQKLAANLCPTASKSTRITPWYPWKLAPLICFQTVVGWLRQTIDLRLSAKTPTVCLSFQGGKSAILTYLAPFTLLILSFTNWNTNFGSFLRVSKSVVGLKQPITARKHIKGASF